ncbi:uncharacterized protein LOC130987782 [Salvia miltiorrhiza]|uniref:uncharacterized protein LOC130987782 n=1 Tax=Salvia miltiorrhiza TaxID=226208 RepID=UPI0025AB63F0|nr:uncharacterized protein LOC130987782 [Salvia miltiorrhiza]
MDSTGDGKSCCNVDEVGIQIFREFHKIMEVVDGKPDQMGPLLIDMEKLTLKYLILNSASEEGKRKACEHIYGVKFPEKITVLPPAVNNSKEMKKKIREQNRMWKRMKTDPWLISAREYMEKHK